MVAGTMNVIPNSSFERKTEYCNFDGENEP